MEYFKNSRPDQRIEKRDIPQNAFAADSAHTGVSVAIATSMRHKRGITGAGAAASGSPARVALRRQFPQLVYNVSRPGRLAPLTPPEQSACAVFVAEQRQPRRDPEVTFSARRRRARRVWRCLLTWPPTEAADRVAGTARC